jgi:hypothetical protein
MLLERVLDEMESLGIVTELAGKVPQQLLQWHTVRMQEQQLSACGNVNC